MMRYLSYHRHRRHFPPGVREREKGEGGERGRPRARHGCTYTFRRSLPNKSKTECSNEKKNENDRLSESCLEVVWTLFVPCCKRTILEDMMIGGTGLGLSLGLDTKIFPSLFFSGF